jgi:DNA-binding transcriptional LysR family regulator
MSDPPSVLGEPRLDNRISLQKLEILCLVVEFGTVTRAAEHLFVAQPVVSAHLRSLEQRLGVTLFVRSGRRIELTEGGERVYAWAAETLARARTMMREVEFLDDGHRGAALIGASMSLGSYRLPGVMTRFRSARPEAELTLVIGDPENVMRGVEQGELDFGIVVLDAAPDGPVLESEILGSEEIALVASLHGVPIEDEIDLAELANLPIVGSPAGSMRRSLVDSVLRSFDAPSYKSVIDLGHPEAMKRAVLEGAGVTLLFESSVGSDIDAGLLRRVRIRDAELSVPIYVVRRSDKQLSALQVQLLEEIREALRPSRIGHAAGSGIE